MLHKQLNNRDIYLLGATLAGIVKGNLQCTKNAYHLMTLMSSTHIAQDALDDGTLVDAARHPELRTVTS
jgi:hypothetical protein